MTLRYKKLLKWLAGVAVALFLAGGIAYHLLMPRMLFLGVPPQQLFLLADAADATGVRFWFWSREKMDDPDLETADFSRYDVIFISSRRMEPLTRPVQDGLTAAAARGAGVFFVPADRREPAPSEPRGPCPRRAGQRVLGGTADRATWPTFSGTRPATISAATSPTRIRCRRQRTATTTPRRPT